MWNNKADWRMFISNLEWTFGFWRKQNGWLSALSFFKASITDLIYNGGTICNKHDKYKCKKCGYPKFLDTLDNYSDYMFN